MKIKQHKDGNFTAVSDNREVLAKGTTLLEAMIECGEMVEAKNKANAPAKPAYEWCGQCGERLLPSYAVCEFCGESIALVGVA